MWCEGATSSEMHEVFGVERQSDSSDDEFADSELDVEDMVEVLDTTEQGIAEPYQSPSKRIMGVRRGPSPTVSEYDRSMKGVDFDNPAIQVALEAAEEGIIFDGSSQYDITMKGEESITLTRAQLDLIKENSFLAGHHYGRRVVDPFPFMSLPAELRLVFYSHYFADRNPITQNSLDHKSDLGRIRALPRRINDNMAHCCATSNVWCSTTRPRISTNLLATCKQIYYEARDDYLYKGRKFHAPVGRFDDKFRRIDPALRFWQYIQHLDLDITAEANKGARFETGNMIVHLVALLRGGQNLKSFRLRYLANARASSVERFQDLNIKGAVSLTQVFKDWHEPSESETATRTEKLERLLFGILGCACESGPARHSPSCKPSPFGDATRKRSIPLLVQ